MRVKVSSRNVTAGMQNWVRTVAGPDVMLGRERGNPGAASVHRVCQENGTEFFLPCIILLGVVANVLWTQNLTN